MLISASVIFLATGHWMSTGIQYLVLEGAGDPSLVCFSYVCLLPVMFLFDKDPISPHWRKIALCGALDLVANYLFSYSLVKAGSAYHTVIYASLTIFVALWRRLMGRYISVLQWISIFVVVGGLVLTVHNVEDDAAAIHASDARHHALKQTMSGPPKADRELLLGIFLSICCVLVMSCVYVFEEWVQSHKPRPSDEAFVWILGAVQTTGTSFRLLTHTIPNWSTIVEEPMKRSKYNVGIDLVIGMYLSVAIACLAHMISFFYLMRASKYGSVILAILQAVRVVFVIGFGAVFLCHEQKSQCLTGTKVVAMLAVTFGATIFCTAGFSKKRLLGLGIPEWVLNDGENSDSAESAVDNHENHNKGEAGARDSNEKTSLLSDVAA